jgi:NAD(P)-dependent dehydrogenase (short-subunit alcohol dehydrogenase family)
MTFDSVSASAENLPLRRIHFWQHRRAVSQMLRAYPPGVDALVDRIHSMGFLTRFVVQRLLVPLYFAREQGWVIAGERGEMARVSAELLDLLLNNAAIINRSAPLWTISAKEFDQVVQVNVMGVANVLRAFLSGMIARRSGVVVNFSSGWGRGTSADVAPYCATKWAVEGLTRALAQELPSGVSAVSFNPGIIDTDMLRSCFGGNAESYPTATAWAEKAAPFLLDIGIRENGHPLTAPA